VLHYILPGPIVHFACTLACSASLPNAAPVSGSELGLSLRWVPTADQINSTVPIAQIPRPSSTKFDHCLVRFVCDLFPTDSAARVAIFLYRSVPDQLEGALKMLDVKMTDVKLTDQFAGHEIAGHENDGLKMQDMKMPAIWEPDFSYHRLFVP